MPSLELRPNGSYYCPDDPGEWGPASAPRVSITDEEGAFLAWVARGRKVLEIGTGVGVSTRYLAQPGSVVLTLDPSEWVRETVWPTLPENVATCTDRQQVGSGFDVAFIDGDHHHSAFIEDVAFCRDRMNVGGVIVAHDATLLGLGPPWMVVLTVHGLGLLFV